MNTHVDDLVAELALDADQQMFPADTAPRAHLASCPRCASLVAELADTLATLALAAAPIASPPPRTLRDSLLAATDPTVPHGPYLSRLARLFDLDFDKMTKVVGDLVDPARWEPTLLPTVQLFHFDGGPRYAKADNGFVRFAAGSFFPPHKHVGEETTLVLSGRLLLDDGDVILPGERMIKADGSNHSFRIPDDEDCLAAVRLLGHIEAI